MLVSITLGFAGILFFGFGALLFFSPTTIQHAEIMVSHPTGLMEIRAFYGGLEMGLGLFLLYALKEDFLRYPALLLTAFILVGIVLGRLTGALVDGVSGNYIYYALAIELPTCLLALYSLFVWKGE